MRTTLTLVFIHTPPKILLGMKKRGFGAGKWNGFGGKLDPGEAVIDAARRELKEEVGIEAEELTKVGIIDFVYNGGSDTREVHIFTADAFSGEPEESEEMKPQWFDADDLPYGEMWADDTHWMPLLLAGKKFKGRFVFDGYDTILEKELSEVEGV